MVCYLSVTSWPLLACYKADSECYALQTSCGGTMCTWFKLACTVLQISTSTESSSRLQESASAHDRVSTPFKQLLVPFRSDGLIRDSYHLWTESPNLRDLDTWESICAWCATSASPAGHFWPAIKPTVNATLLSGSCGGTMCTWFKLVCTVLQVTQLYTETQAAESDCQKTKARLLQVSASKQTTIEVKVEETSNKPVEAESSGITGSRSSQR
ncbi:hypothetical protein MRX96_011966 [Rhipicephalus microplus]